MVWRAQACFCTVVLVSAVSLAGPSTPGEQTVGYLDFFRRWDTPQDDRAAETFSRDHDKKLSSIGSEQRALVERHLASFEEAADLIRKGKMREDLFLDGWYEMPRAWDKARPLVLEMRSESKKPELYQGFEWLAGEAKRFWAERAKNPPHWIPLGSSPPTADDKAIFAAFTRIWSTPRDQEGRVFFADLEKRLPSFEEFSRSAPSGSENFTHFDRVLCAYAQAGVLIQNGILHPALFFAGWRSPTEIWAVSGRWVKPMREAQHSPRLYESVDWLVDFEKSWKAAH